MIHIYHYSACVKKPARRQQTPDNKVVFYSSTNSDILFFLSFIYKYKKKSIKHQILKKNKKILLDVYEETNRIVD